MCSPRGSYPAGLQHRHLLRPLFSFHPFSSPLLSILLFVFIMRMKLCFLCPSFPPPLYKFHSTLLYPSYDQPFSSSFPSLSHVCIINVNGINTKAVVILEVFDNLIFDRSANLFSPLHCFEFQNFNHSTILEWQPSFCATIPRRKCSGVSLVQQDCIFVLITAILRAFVDHDIYMYVYIYNLKDIFNVLDLEQRSNS